MRNKLQIIRELLSRNNKSSYDDDDDDEHFEHNNI